MTTVLALRSTIAPERIIRSHLIRRHELSLRKMGPQVGRPDFALKVCDLREKLLQLRI
jgi:hypothetical protein